MPEFVPVARLDELSDPGRLTIAIDDRLVVLVRIGGDVFCLDDVCTHDGGPLGEGPLVDTALVCPRHGAKFDVRDGRALTMPATEPTVVHEVQVVDGEIRVRLRDE